MKQRTYKLYQLDVMYTQKECYADTYPATIITQKTPFLHESKHDFAGNQS